MKRILTKLRWFIFFKRNGYPHPEEIGHQAVKLYIDKKISGSIYSTAVCYNYYRDIAKTAEVLKVTRERVRQVLMKVRRAYRSKK